MGFMSLDARGLISEAMRERLNDEHMGFYKENSLTCLPTALLCKCISLNACEPDLLFLIGASEKAEPI